MSLKRILIIIGATICALSCSNDADTIYQFKAESNAGEEVKARFS